MEKVVLVLLFFNLLFIFSFGIKVMLIGGALSSDQTDIFQGILSHINKTPYNCGEDLFTTKCPIIAVITSAA
jgi:hypothetical protein